MLLKISDEYAMRRCLELALNGSGYVSPNPLVGAVIVNNGEIISEGWHKKYGDIHAEIDAMQNSSLASFEGMTLVVNLEPCSHHGKQPPCTDAIIAGKFARVVIGMQDPNPLVGGSGIENLKSAGIEVATGILEDDCKWINRFFCKYIAQQKPYITMKVAMSLDGCIATKGGESKWITCEESRRRVHILRSESDAVLVGIGTIIADNPLLDVRFTGGNNPSAVVLDSNLKISPDSNDVHFTGGNNPSVVVLDSNLKISPDSNDVHFTGGNNPAVVVLDSNLKISPDSNLITSLSTTTNRRKIIVAYTNSTTNKEQILLDAGVTLLKVPASHKQHIDLEFLLARLAEEEKITSILVEGGAGVFSSFMEQDLVDELHIFSAPIFIGDGFRAFNFDIGRHLSNSKKYQFASSIKSNTDLHLLLLRR